MNGLAIISAILAILAVGGIVVNVVQLLAS